MLHLPPRSTCGATAKLCSSRWEKPQGGTDLGIGNRNTVWWVWTFRTESTRTRRIWKGQWSARVKSRQGCGSAKTNPKDPSWWQSTSNTVNVQTTSVGTLWKDWGSCCRSYGIDAVSLFATYEDPFALILFFKIHEQSENLGFPANQWAIRKSMRTCEDLWESPKICQIPWNSHKVWDKYVKGVYNVYEHQWTSMNIWNKLSKPMEIYDNARKSDKYRAAGSLTWVPST